MFIKKRATCSCRRSVCQHMLQQFITFATGGHSTLPRERFSEMSDTLSLQTAGLKPRGRRYRESGELARYCHHGWNRATPMESSSFTECRIMYLSISFSRNVLRLGLCIEYLPSVSETPHLIALRDREKEYASSGNRLGEKLDECLVSV